MSKTPNPFQTLEMQAYHAYREWHVWLVLRERELSKHLSNSRPAAAAPPRTPAGQPSSDQPLD